jgi:hypothetical protein
VAGISRVEFELADRPIGDFEAGALRAGFRSAAAAIATQ